MNKIEIDGEYFENIAQNWIGERILNRAEEILNVLMYSAKQKLKNPENAAFIDIIAESNISIINLYPISPSNFPAGGIVIPRGER